MKRPARRKGLTKELTKKIHVYLAVQVLVLQVLFTGVLCLDCHAILPKSKAQIQATQNDSTLIYPQDIGSILDEREKGNASAVQVLAVRNSILSSIAKTQVGTTGRSLKLLVSVTQGTASDAPAADGLSLAADYSVSAAAEFRDVIHFKASKSVTSSTTAHLIFRLSGQKLTATEPTVGAIAVMGGEVRLAIDNSAVINEAGGTNSSLGKFDGGSYNLDVAFPVILDGSSPTVQLDALLYISGIVSTFYAANTFADYVSNGAGLILYDAYVEDATGTRVGGVSIFGDSGYIYTAKSLDGHFAAKDKAKKVSFQADISGTEDGGDAQSLAAPKAAFKLSVNGVKYTGEANVSGVGPMTFGESQATKLQLKKKNKPTRTLTLTVKQAGDDYEIAGTIKEKGKSGSVKFTAKHAAS